MKRTISFLLLGIALLALSVRIIKIQKGSGEADRIERVERGLLTSTVIKGRPGPMTLAQRMAYYQVPGVSVAVVNNGKLEWAKGYGVVEAGGAKPVTTETRFQAASISKPVTAVAALALVQMG